MTRELRIGYEPDAGDPQTLRIAMRSGRREVLRFFVRSSGPPLHAGGEALLCFGLLPALELGCRLRIDAPVDSGLLASVADVQQLVAGWTPGCRPVEIIATGQGVAAPRGIGAGLFFSGGVDSAYSLVTRRPELDGLVTIVGCDVELDDRTKAGRLVGIAGRAAAATGLESVVIETDLPRRMHRYLGWIEYHGSALAGIRHLFRERFCRMFVAASCEAETAWECPWGSHPGLDPRLGTAAASIEIDGMVPRIDKIRRLLAEPRLLADLRVCYHGGDNCGTCSKCVFTRHALAVLDAEHAGFPGGSIPLGPFSAGDTGDRAELRALRAAAVAAGGHESLVSALDRAMAAGERRANSLNSRLRTRQRVRRLRHRFRFLVDGLRVAA